MVDADKFTVNYTTRDIMDKLNSMHVDVKTTNGSVKFHTKLIWGSYGFTFAILVIFIKCVIGG